MHLSNYLNIYVFLIDFFQIKISNFKKASKKVRAWTLRKEHSGKYQEDLKVVCNEKGGGREGDKRSQVSDYLYVNI
jgi:hypothetical protein